MKICYNTVREFSDKNILWISVSFVLVIWSCYCLQGDEARPILVSQVSDVTCHVIFESGRRHVTKGCSCKCWIWCQSTLECTSWSKLTQQQLMQPRPNRTSHTFKVLNSACRTCCEENLNAPFVYKYDLLPDFLCNSAPHHHQAPYCGFHPVSNSCCSVVCSSEQHVGTCLYFYPNVSDISSTYSKPKNLKTISSNDTREVPRRRKRTSDFQLPFRIEALNDQNKFIAHQPFDLRVQLIDKEGSLVPDTGREVELKIVNSENGSEETESLKTVLQEGTAAFSNIYFKQSGESYRLSVVSRDSPSVRPWTSEKLIIDYRQLILRPSSQKVPLPPRENETLSPTVGVVIYDVMNDKRADKSYLLQYTWEAKISLLYENIYSGQLLGTTEKLVRDGSNSILFKDIVINEWGYSYILKIHLTAKETLFWNLTCLIGPFNVDILDTLEQPLVDSREFRDVKVIFDGDYSIVEKDPEKFKIFFRNHFGRKYPKVRWKNVTTSRGSIMVDARITGLSKDLDETSKSLENDIQNGNGDVTYDGFLLKANQNFLPSRKLLEETGESAEEGAGGLSVAWIVAIVINVVLIVVFIIAIIYCYCRRNKKRSVSRSATLQNFDGGPKPLLYGNKAENKGLQDKAAIFTVEDSRTKLEEENEDDPQGYPTPSPEPRFPTPEPSPEPEEYWREEEEEEEEPEEEEEMFLPGAASNPSPELPKEERFYVYSLTDFDGSREMIGQIYLKVDSFLAETRRAIDSDRDLSNAIRGRDYRFLDENLDTVLIYQESSLDLERMYPSQRINIQYLPAKVPTPKPQVTIRPKMPAYVGPLGICNAADCSRAAKIKCLDCRNVNYCSKRCMSDDAKDHRRACFKPAWRV